MAACPEFHVACRLGRELFTLPIYCRRCPWSHGRRPKNFIILVVWWWHQLLSWSLPNGYLFWVSCSWGRKLFKPPSYTCNSICYQKKSWKWTADFVHQMHQKTNLQLLWIETWEDILQIIVLKLMKFQSINMVFSIGYHEGNCFSGYMNLQPKKFSTTFLQTNKILKYKYAVFDRIW